MNPQSNSTPPGTKIIPRAPFKFTHTSLSSKWVNNGAKTLPGIEAWVYLFTSKLIYHWSYIGLKPKIPLLPKKRQYASKETTIYVQRNNNSGHHQVDGRHPSFQCWPCFLLMLVMLPCDDSCASFQWWVCFLQSSRGERHQQGCNSNAPLAKVLFENKVVRLRMRGMVSCSQPHDLLSLDDPSLMHLERPC